MSTKRTDNAKEDWDEKNPVHRRQLAKSINNALAGRLNSTGSLITAGAGKTSTTVSDLFCGLTTVVMVEPTTANTNAMKANVWVSTIGRGAFTVTHPDTVSSTFYYVLIG